MLVIPVTLYGCWNCINGDFAALSSDITGYAFTDEETREAMREVYSKIRIYLLILMALLVTWDLKKYLNESNEQVTGVFPGDCASGKIQGGSRGDVRAIPLTVPPALRNF